jgi:hypothetical protein
MAGIRYNAVPNVAQRASAAYSGRGCELSKNELRGLRIFLKVSKSAYLLHCARKLRQSLPRKAEAKLVPTAAPGRAPSRTRSCPLIQTRSCPLIHMRPLEPLLSRLLWLYSRAVQTEVLADNSL